MKCGALMELSELCSVCIFPGRLSPLTSAVVFYSWRYPNHQMTASAIQTWPQVFVCICDHTEPGHGSASVA